MIIIENTLISEEIIEKKFVCDLSSCHGDCCVKGDYGAPLEKEELEILDTIYDTIKPYITEEGIKAIERQGKYLLYEGKEWVTPLMKGKACAYTYWEGKIAKCGIEKAYYEGKVGFKKPISCHLYPVRITKQKNGMEALNYDRWSVCRPACKLGENLQVPIYKFLKESLVRKYGETWYEHLELAAKHIEEQAAAKKSAGRSEKKIKTG